MKAIPVLLVEPMLAFTISILPRRRSPLEVSEKCVENVDAVCVYYEYVDLFDLLFITVVSRMMFPTSLLVLFCLLAVGFLLSLAVAIYTQKSEVDYRFKKLSSVDSPDGRSYPSSVTGVAGAAMYQSSARADYAIPQSQNVVTYCVIDDRLIDK